MKRQKVVLLEISAHQPAIGNGRNAVSRVLFRKRELSEFCGKPGEFCEKLGEFALAHTHTCKAERNSLSSLRGTR